MKQPSIHSHPNSLLRRRRLDLLFQAFGVIAIGAAALSLITLLLSVSINAVPALFEHRLAVPIQNNDASSSQNPQITILRGLQSLFPEALSRSDQRALLSLLSRDAPKLLRSLPQNSTHLHAPLSADAETLLKNPSQTRIPQHIAQQLLLLNNDGFVSTHFHSQLFTSPDSRDPERAGILSSLVGSLYTFLVTLILAAPLGVLAAVHLEEFARPSKLTSFIEININNLAAVPSIVFGLLGLAILIGAFHLPRSTPLVGGVTLALLALPTIVIAARASLRSTPFYLREAAYGLGASKVQTIFHHVLPAAAPGVLTGVIIALAGAVGETAPLIMIGMIAFIPAVPASPIEPATTLPVQIFLWADSPERLFAAKTSAAVVILLIFVFSLNIAAVLLRQKLSKNQRFL